jgi:peroxiredoxin Q/BCP
MADMKEFARTQSERASKHKVDVGDVAPDFALPSQFGEIVTLKSLAGQTNIVLVFYPKDDSPVCTAEACAFRDSYELFRVAGAEVVGISSDSTASHSRFAAKHRLPFILLSDRSGDVRKRYGVPNTLGPLPGRATYVIDRQGIVRHVFSSQFNAARHVTEALNALRKLS